MATTLPARDLGAFSQFKTLYLQQLRLISGYRKTRALALIQMLPVFGALAYVLIEDVDGLTMFSGITETLIFPFLIPLAALFFGGPAVVDEMEGRTLTFLTLRPIKKSTLFLGKVAAGSTAALVLVIVPLTLLFLSCLWQSSDIGASVESFGQIVFAASCGVVVYSTLFAALGAAFESSLLASIIYFVVFEMVLAALPVLELVSIRYHLRTIAGFSATDRLGILDKMVLEEPIIFQWWVGAIVVGLLISAASLIGAWVFSEKQYHV